MFIVKTDIHIHMLSYLSISYSKRPIFIKIYFYEAIFLSWMVFIQCHMNFITERNVKFFIPATPFTHKKKSWDLNWLSFCPKLWLGSCGLNKSCLIPKKMMFSPYQKGEKERKERNYLKVYQHVNGYTFIYLLDVSLLKYILFVLFHHW